MQSAVDRERRWINAIVADPVVAERLASRELGFTNPGVVTVAVALDSAPQSHESLGAAALATPTGANQSHGPGKPARWRPVLYPSRPSGWIARAAETLPNLNYDAVFCDTQTRLVVMALSLALLSVAICLPNRRSSL